MIHNKNRKDNNNEDEEENPLDNIKKMKNNSNKKNEDKSEDEEEENLLDNCKKLNIGKKMKIIMKKKMKMKILQIIQEIK